MKKLTKLTALLLAGLLSASLLLACNDGFDYTEEDEDEDDEKVTTTAPTTTTEVTSTTTDDSDTPTPTPGTTEKKDEVKPTTNPPAENPEQGTPQPTKPDPMPSKIYQQLITTENVTMNADISEEAFYCHLVKYGDLAEYYEYNYGEEVSFTKFYNLATQTVYYEDDGKWYSVQENFGSFADLMEQYGFGKESIFFRDDSFDHYDDSTMCYELDESLLDPQNGLLWGKMIYPHPVDDTRSYNFQCQRVDQQLIESYGFTVNSTYPIMLPNDFEWID
ncbi:MAG: hypothetical protein J6R82_02720 [Clostridia bacterium]|nr:hypothetical protein [Clostridia bacterium]